jgi:hypothetical protein
MDKHEFNNKVKQRRKRCLTSRLGTNLLLLLPPAIALAALLAFAGTTFLITLFLIYLILPMFYTVLYRLKFDITGIGDPDFSYKDGYKAFFSETMSGVFGMLNTVFTTLAMTILFYLVFSPLLGPLTGAYGQYDTYKTIFDALNNQSLNAAEAMETVTENIALLAQPLTALIGIILFFPIFYAIFFSSTANLENHYLATVVLPDIDKNITAGQARALSRGSFGHLYSGYRLAKAFRYNWPYYLTFTIAYAASVYGMSMVKTDNMYLVSILALAAPGASIIYGVYLNYFCLMNDAIVIEESQDYIRSLLPKTMQFSIYQTYINPNYIHGEESAIRGSFIPAPKEAEYQEFQQNNLFNPNNFQNQPPREENNPYTTFYQASQDKPEEPKENEPESPKNDPVGNVVDLSQSTDNKENQ